MNLLGQEDIFDISYYLVNDNLKDGQSFYEDFMHAYIPQWKEASEQIENNSNYLYSCEANPLESDFERSNPEILLYRNLTVLVMFILACLSMITCLFVSGTIYFDKGLRNAHPSMLLGMMSIAEFVTCY